MMCTGVDKSDLPTKEYSIRDKQKREELESKIFSMTPYMKGSDRYWHKKSEDVDGANRYFEDPPPYRERMPLSILFFQTRAILYNHHPVVHPLFPNWERVSKLSDEEYFKARLANTLEFPGIVQWVGTFMYEILTTIGAPVLYDSSMYFLRFEWGANGNPHQHGLLYSEKISETINGIRLSLTKEIDEVTEVFTTNHW